MNTYLFFACRLVGVYFENFARAEILAWNIVLFDVYIAKLFFVVDMQVDTLFFVVLCARIIYVVHFAAIVRLVYVVRRLRDRKSVV